MLPTFLSLKSLYYPVYPFENVEFQINQLLPQLFESIIHSTAKGSTVVPEALSRLDFLAYIVVWWRQNLFLSADTKDVEKKSTFHAL
jgi:hypothetical protein